MRTGAGQVLVDDAVAAGALVLGAALTPADLDEMQPHQVRKKIALAARYEGMAQAGERLRNFIASAAQATRLGAVFDDEASGRGLRNFFARAIACGAITAAEAKEATGLEFG